MSLSIILCAEDEISSIITEFAANNTKEFSITYVTNSYETCIDKAVELKADIIIFQLLHPIYRVQNFFVDLMHANISPTLLAFHLKPENVIAYSVTSNPNQHLLNRLKHFFQLSLIERYNCRFNTIGEAKDSNLIMNSRIKTLEKAEYLKDILRGVTYNEFLYYKKIANLNLNLSGYYLYICNLLDIEYSDHDLNKNIYYFVGEEFVKESQDVLDSYHGGEAFYINPLLIGIIINADHSKSEATQQRVLLEVTNKLNKVMDMKTALKYRSTYIKNIEDIREGYEAFHRQQIYFFFCQDAPLITQEYIHSIRKEIDYTVIDEILREIKEIINLNIADPKLIQLIKQLFLDYVKPSLSYNLFYYCQTSLLSALVTKYNSLCNNTFSDSYSPRELFYCSIEQRCNDFIENILLLKGKLSNSTMVKNSFVLQAIDFIHNHYADEITVNYIAENLNISNSYLSQMFTKEMGISPIKYLVSYRIQKAKELISSSKDLLVADVASKVGFFEVKHFSKTFKKVTGLTPMQYKKNHGKIEFITVKGTN
ncbi:helix-turn-helix domain-containing protein [Halalkalibacter okhensis]|uniref:helix-turn-helix domain-containing protein n=1 Tax=Halalkalibacter okhensis TaxID=333138 RepID=UPI00068A49A0|nr:AraC family transcriptional regulator [Halalkalibacter okhensis]